MECVCDVPCSYGTAVCVSPGTAGAAAGLRAAAGPGRSGAAALTASVLAAGADAAYGWRGTAGVEHPELETHTQEAQNRTELLASLQSSAQSGIAAHEKGYSTSQHGLHVMIY